MQPEADAQRRRTEMARARRRQQRARAAGQEGLMSLDEAALQTSQVVGQTDIFEQVEADD